MSRFLTLIALLPLALGSCIAVPVDTVQTDGAMGRQIARVLSRHDSYVIADLSLAADEAQRELAESDKARALAILPEVRRDSLSAALAPVLQRHDKYVGADVALDDLRRAVYLAASDQLRRVLKAPE